MQEMKRIMFALAWVGLFVARVSPVEAQKLSAKGGVDQFTAAAGLSLELAGQTNCVILLRGPVSMQRSGYTAVKHQTNITLTTEILSLDMSGSGAGLGTVRLLAGSNAVGLATLGQIQSTSATNFPAASNFQAFFLLQLPGGTNLVNVQPLPLFASINTVPPISQIYTNTGTAGLVQSTDTNIVAGQIVQLWLAPAVIGRRTEVGMSFDVIGTNTLGTMTVEVCPEGTATTATMSLQSSQYAGPITVSSGCDELTDTNLVFAASWDARLSAPHWRGEHTGRFIIYRLDPRGRTNLVAFGTVEGSMGVGSHRAPLAAAVEDCAACQHFEGALTGKFVEKGELNGAELHGTYAGEYLDETGQPVTCCPPPATPPHGPFRMTVDGLVVTGCLAP
jgi:hypothetical protein